VTPPHRLRTLGELRLEAPETAVLRRKERVLLAYLARRAPDPVRRAVLADLLWEGHDATRARHSLRQALFSLRRVLGEDIDADAESVALRADAVETDVAALERDVREGRAVAALARWSGDFLAGMEDVAGESLRGWIDAERAGLRRLLERAMERLVADTRVSGGWDEVVPIARRWAEAHPWEEEAHAILIEALRGAGLADEAVAWHARAVERMREVADPAPSTGFLELVPGSVSVPPRDRRAPPLPPEQALAELLDAWRATAAGGAPLVCVEGSAAARAALLSGGLVPAALRAAPDAVVLAGLPLPAAGPWGRAASLLAPLRHAAGLSGVDDRSLAEVALLVPSIRDRFPGLPDAGGCEEVLRRAAVHTLGEVAGEIPVLLVADGASGADPETRRWLAALAIARPANVMVVLGGEPSELAADPLLRPVASAADLRTLSLAAPSSDGPGGPGERAGRTRTEVRRGARWRLPGAVAASVLVAAALLMAWTHGSRTARPPVFAVGTVQGPDIDADDPTVAALPEILSTQLARIPTLQVVSRARMRELSTGLPGDLTAARAARADELVEGELFVGRGAGYLLELRRVEVRSGRVLASYTIEAPDALELGQQAAAAMARSLGLAEPPASTYGPGSVAARALYEEGLRVYFHDGDLPRARDFFVAALAQDSLFATAALYAAITGSPTDPQERIHALLERAEALAGAAPDRDRLLITAYTTSAFNELRAGAVAETLAVRYPADPNGPLLLGVAHSAAGDFDAAVTQFRRAIALEPVGDPATVQTSPICPVCNAYAGLVQAYWLADSFPAAIRTSREWAALRPRNAMPWEWLVVLLNAVDRPAEAAVASGKLAELRPPDALHFLRDAQDALRRGDFTRADHILEAAARSTDPGVARMAAWWQVVSLRHQRRLAEALQVARRYRRLHPAGPPVHPVATAEAVVLLESGRARSAAVLFDSMFHALPDAGRASQMARSQSWLLTLRGSALAAAGDTAHLARLADSVQHIGARSAYGRDRRLHHHLRGLLARARGDLPKAEAEFRAAVYSEVGGYTRSNLELARVLAAQGRHAEALPPLRSALRAPLDGPALYVTRTELHEAAALAFDALGQADSAAVYRRRAGTRR
jgi:DNA-binding SARP family transcriptional activator/tetratricopeptide (TPR) repeat protein